MGAEGETPLSGGRSRAPVVRVGETVRRDLHANSAYVHALLRHLEDVGFTGAPRLLGIDEQRREILSFIAGEVPHDSDEIPLSGARLASAARLIAAR